MTPAETQPQSWIRKLKPKHAKWLSEVTPRVNDTVESGVLIYQLLVSFCHTMLLNSEEGNAYSQFL